MSRNETDHQNQSHLQSSGGESSVKSHHEVLKRRSLILSVMKPSLSLTSLPPQSPKEKTLESISNTERPYNSLKVGLWEFVNKNFY